jgi:hypothetical protein
MTYVLRRYLRSAGDRLLTSRDLREYIVRLVLGTVFGVAIGFFTTAQNVIANPVSSLGAPALAFLAGYGEEAVFRMLDAPAGRSPKAPETPLSASFGASQPSMVMGPSPRRRGSRG